MIARLCVPAASPASSALGPPGVVGRAWGGATPAVFRPLQGRAEGAEASPERVNALACMEPEGAVHGASLLSPKARGEGRVQHRRHEDDGQGPWTARSGPFAVLGGEEQDQEQQQYDDVDGGTEGQGHAALLAGGRD